MAPRSKKIMALIPLVIAVSISVKTLDQQRMPIKTRRMLRKVNLKHSR